MLATWRQWEVCKVEKIHFNPTRAEKGPDFSMCGQTFICWQEWKGHQTMHQLQHGIEEAPHCQEHNWLPENIQMCPKDRKSMRTMGVQWKESVKDRKGISSSKKSPTQACVHQGRKEEGYMSEVQDCEGLKKSQKPIN